MPHSSPRQPGAWRPTIECLEARQVPSTISTTGHGHDSDPAAIEAMVQQAPDRVEAGALASPGDSWSQGEGHGHGLSGLALMELPDKPSDPTPKSPEQEVDMADHAMSGVGNSGKHATGERDNDSLTGAVDEQIQKALGDAQSLEDTIPLDVTRIIKSVKGQADRAASGGSRSDQEANRKGSDSASDSSDSTVSAKVKSSSNEAAIVEKGQADRVLGKGEKAGNERDAATRSDSPGDASEPVVSAKSGSTLDDPAVVDQSELPAGNVASAQSPGRAARTGSHAAGTDAPSVAGGDLGTTDSASEAAPADGMVGVAPGPEAAGEPAKATLAHASPFAIDLLMSTTASRATLAILATGLAGMEHEPSTPVALVPAEADVQAAGAEAEPPPTRDTNPVAGMGEEPAPDSGNEMHPGTPVQSLAAAGLGVGLDVVVDRVERALDSVVVSSSLRRLLPWLAGAGLAIAAIDVVRRQKPDREQGRRDTVGGDHDADTWLPRSITEKA